MINIIIDPNLKPKDDLSNINPKVYVHLENGIFVNKISSNKEVKFIHNG